MICTVWQWVLWLITHKSRYSLSYITNHDYHFPSYILAFSSLFNNLEQIWMHQQRKIISIMTQKHSYNRQIKHKVRRKMAMRIIIFRLRNSLSYMFQCGRIFTYIWTKVEERNINICIICLSEMKKKKERKCFALFLPISYRGVVRSVLVGLFGSM